MKPEANRQDRKLRIVMPSLEGSETPHVAFEESLRLDVEMLAHEIGPRHFFKFGMLEKAADFVEQSFEEAGLEVRRQEYRVLGKTCANIEAVIPGTKHPEEIVIVGAHYDTPWTSPGANDNGSGIAALLAIARELAGLKSGQPLKRTLRLVAFTNEERPFIRTRRMGSRVYARACRERNERILGMLCLETIGCCRKEKGSQRLAGPIRKFVGNYPDRGDFLAFVSNAKSRALLAKTVRGFVQGTDRPHREFVLPEIFPGAWSSDHWSFWREGFPALMLTDTAPLRYPHYHKADDTADKIDYVWLADVVRGLGGAVRALVA